MSCPAAAVHNAAAGWQGAGPTPVPSPRCRTVAESAMQVLQRPTPATDSMHLVASPQQQQQQPERPASPTKRAAEELQKLPGERFVFMLEALLLLVVAFLDHCVRVGAAVQAILAAAQASRQQQDAVAQETKDACQAVAEVAAARWAKQLSGRAHGGKANSVRCGEGGEFNARCMPGADQGGAPGAAPTCCCHPARPPTGWASCARSWTAPTRSQQWWSGTACAACWACGTRCTSCARARWTQCTRAA